MEIDRRTLLVGGVLALSSRAARAGTSAPEFASACRRSDGRFAVVLLDGRGQIKRELPLIERAHDIAIEPRSGTAVVFARQPGQFAVAFSWRNLGAPVLFAPPENRCFFGHGIFSLDGRLLYATENDLDNGSGLVGVYDAGAGFRRIGEMKSHGVGPHELVLLADGLTLAIANGGYETVPASGRSAIDIASMRPSLVFIDRRAGDVRAQHELPPPLRPLSIRHLAAHRDGRVWFGCQWEGDRTSMPDLIGSAGVDRALTFAPLGAPSRAEAAATGLSLKGYVGSVSLSGDGSTLAASAPRAGRILLIDCTTGALRSTIPIADGCGLAAVGDRRFAITSGTGALAVAASNGTREVVSEVHDLAYDNHLRRLPV